MHSNFYREWFFPESFPHRRLTHRRFYAQHFFTFFTFYTDAFAQQSNCTQKLVHTAHFYTQPVFTQRGSASPSSSATFRVPPFQVAFTYQLAETHTQPCMQISAPLHVHGYVVMHNVSMYGHSAHVFCAGEGARFTIFTWSTAEIMELPMVTPSGHSYDFTSIVPAPRDWAEIAWSATTKPWKHDKILYRIQHNGWQNKCLRMPAGKRKQYRNM